MQAQSLKAVVLAAGVGSRLDPLTRELPKPLLPFANAPVMEHTIRLLKRHGIEEIYANLHHKPDQITDYFGDGSEYGVALTFVHEPALTGDAGGVRALKEYLGSGTFIVLMGDLITDVDLSYVLSQHRNRGALATIGLKQVDDVRQFGIVTRGEGGLITGFVEKPEPASAPSNVASCGVYVFEPEIFDHIGVSEQVGFGKDVFPALLQRKMPLYGVETWGYWSDVGTIAQYRRSTADALEGLIDLQINGEPFDKGWIGEGSIISDDATIDGKVLLGKQAYIGKNVTIKGYAVVGDNCIIEDDVQLQDSIIWSNTRVGINSFLRASIVSARKNVPAGSVLLESVFRPPPQRGVVSTPGWVPESLADEKEGEPEPGTPGVLERTLTDSSTDQPWSGY